MKPPSNWETRIRGPRLVMPIQASEPDYWRKAALQQARQSGRLLAAMWFARELAIHLPAAHRRRVAVWWLEHHTHYQALVHQRAIEDWQSYTRSVEEDARRRKVGAAW